MRIGLLTGGGDCPGLNAAIRSVVRHGHAALGHTIVAFRNGWRGVLEGHAHEVTRDEVRGLLPRGGTILGTSGVQPFRIDGGIDRVAEAVRAHRLDGFIVLGGEGSIGAAAAMPEIPVIGVPKTIDNDVAGTDASIGHHTAVQIATDAIDRLHSTAESHNRVMVAEVMGRSAGWIGLSAGLAGGADVILIPERAFDIEQVCETLRKRHAEHSSFSIVVVAEGAAPVEATMDTPDYPLDDNGWPRLGGIGGIVAAQIETRTGFQTRVTVLGHVQRGGTPNAFDRILASRLGMAAVDQAVEGRWGSVVGIRGEGIVTTALSEVAAAPNLVPDERCSIPEVLLS